MPGGDARHRSLKNRTISPLWHPGALRGRQDTAMMAKGFECRRTDHSQCTRQPDRVYGPSSSEALGMGRVIPAAQTMPYFSSSGSFSQSKRASRLLAVTLSNRYRKTLITSIMHDVEPMRTKSRPSDSAIVQYVGSKESFVCLDPAPVEVRPVDKVHDCERRVRVSSRR